MLRALLTRVKAGRDQLRQSHEVPGRRRGAGSAGVERLGDEGSSVNGGVVDNAICVDGIRTANPATLDEIYELLRERQGMAWIGLYRPTSEEIRSVAAEFGLRRLVV